MQKGLPERKHTEVSAVLHHISLQMGYRKRMWATRGFGMFLLFWSEGSTPIKKISPQLYFSSSIFGERRGENHSIPLSSTPGPSCEWWTGVEGDDYNLYSSGSVLVSFSHHTATTPQLLLWYIVAWPFGNLFCEWLLRVGKKFSAGSGQI